MAEGSDAGRDGERDAALLQRFDRPTLLSQGTTSPPMFSAIVDRLASTLPNASRHTFTGAGHVPHLSHSADYVNAVRAFMR